MAYDFTLEKLQNCSFLHVVQLAYTVIRMKIINDCAEVDCLPFGLKSTFQT